MDIEFLSLLLNAYNVLVQKGSIKSGDWNMDVFNLNIAELNLHEDADASVIAVYEKIIANTFQK